MEPVFPSVTKAEHDEMKRYMREFVNRHIGLPISKDDGISIIGPVLDECKDMFGSSFWNGTDAYTKLLPDAMTTLKNAMHQYIDAYIDTHWAIKEPKTFKVQGNLDGPFLGTFAQFVTAYDEIEAEDMVKQQFGGLVIIRAVKEYCEQM